MSWDLNQKPILVFWETTRACDLACKHCRASAMKTPPPDELSHEEGLRVLDQIVEFGRPYPILILTGGDVLKRSGLWEMIRAAKERGIAVAVSPSVTPLLTEEVLQRFLAAEVSAISFSLDGSDAEGHDALRGVPGTWERTLQLAGYAAEIGLRVQINTTVMKWNLGQLPTVFRLIKEKGVDIWEVFFLIHEGRGEHLEAATPEECEGVCQFLAEAAGYGLTVRTVEAPFFRRVVQQHKNGQMQPNPLGAELVEELHRQLGPPDKRPQSRSALTRDGNGLLFISYRGDVTPSGFLPVVAGNLREQTLAEIYREQPAFVALRAAESFLGRCGSCDFRQLCGGSRARAYTTSGNYLSEDPACAYTPVN
ncbi:TIGR04053 family radical SAM/SPASM domain-containing protein [bacterium]|nr:TIGR04053 family radical SAM/SPASM domain-containing protein [bacterium]